MNQRETRELCEMFDDFRSTENHLHLLKQLKEYPDKYGYLYCRVCGNEECKHTYQLGDFHPSDLNYSVCGICLKKYYTYSFDVLKEEPARATLSMRFKIFERDGFKCVYCGRSPKKDNDVELHVDHVYPKSKGGNDLPDNLVTSCKECNIGKSDYILLIFRR